MAGTPGDYDTAIDFLHIVQEALGIEQPSEDPVFSAGTKESRHATLSIPWLRRPKAWVDVYYPVMNSPLDRSLEILNDDGSVSWKADIEEVTEEEIVRRFYYILLTVTYGLVCSMITYLFQMYLILMIY